MSLTPISSLRQEILDLYDKIGSYLGVAQELYIRHEGLAKPNQLRSYVKSEVEWQSRDMEIVEENVRLAKNLQRLSDDRRVKDKAFREYARVENAVTMYNDAILAELDLASDHLRNAPRRSGPLDPEAAVLVVHLSDNHMNELVNLPSNRFDFQVAAKRLQLLAQKTKLLGKAYGAERIVVFFGGDLMNSDRRLDELLAQATNRARATLLAVHLYKQFLLDLRADFFLDCFGVTGNESRAKDNLGWVDVVATDNYDMTIYSMLELLLADDKGLRFHDFVANEVIFSIHGETFLGVHGHQVSAGDQKKCQAIIGKYAARGIKITHILCGHIHSTMIGDYVSRNSSLVGSNAYSEEALQYVSKASQNIHIVTKKGLDGVKCDLQNIDGVEGYEIVPQLEAYCARSAEKAHEALIEPQVLVKVII